MEENIINNEVTEIETTAVETEDSVEEEGRSLSILEIAGGLTLIGGGGYLAYKLLKKLGKTGFEKIKELRRNHKSKKDSDVTEVSEDEITPVENNK